MLATAIEGDSDEVLKMERPEFSEIKDYDYE